MGRQDDMSTAGGQPGDREPRAETCRIVTWRGYRNTAFYASATDGPSGESVGEPSSSFRSRRGAVPDSPEARAAHLEIVSRLEADGWVQTGQGDKWYATELTRTILVPAQAPAPPEPELLPELEPEPEPAPVPVWSAPPSPPEPDPQPAVAAAPPAPAAEVRTRRRVDGWRMAAAAGLVAALGLLGWAATHPAALDAAGPPPQPAVGRAAVPPVL